MKKKYRDQHLEQVLKGNCPKWIKEIFGVMCNELDKYERQMEEIHGKKETNVFIQDLMDTRNLPKDSRVMLIVNGIKIHVFIRKEYGKETLEINSDTAIDIKPRAANCCYITPEER